MAAALSKIAWKLLRSAEGKIGRATLGQVMTSLGVAIDKMRLLRGEATDISERHDDARHALFVARYAQVDEEAQKATAADLTLTADDLRDGPAAPRGRPRRRRRPQRPALSTPGWCSRSGIIGPHSPRGTCDGEAAAGPEA